MVNNPVNLVDPSGLRLTVGTDTRLRYNRNTKTVSDTRNGNIIPVNKVDNYLSEIESINHVNNRNNVKKFGQFLSNSRILKTLQDSISYGRTGDDSLKLNYTLRDVSQRINDLPLKVKIKSLYNGIKNGFISDVKFLKDEFQLIDRTDWSAEDWYSNNYEAWDIEQTISDIKAFNVVLRKNMKLNDYYITVPALSPELKAEIQGKINDAYYNPDKIIEMEGELTYKIVRDILIAKGVEKLSKTITVVDDVANETTKIIKFNGDEAVNHFDLHGKQVMDALGKKSYNLKEYIIMLLKMEHMLKN